MSSDASEAVIGAFSHFVDAEETCGSSRFLRAAFRLAFLVARPCQATASPPATDVRCIMRPELRS